MAPFQIPKESVDFDKINNVLVAINYNLVNIHLFKFDNRTTRKRCEICCKLTIKTSELRERHITGAFIVTLKIFTPFHGVSKFEHVFAFCERELGETKLRA